MTSDDRVSVLGTGLIGTSIAMAAGRAGAAVRGFDLDPEVLGRAVARSGLEARGTLEEAVEGSTLVFVCTPIGSTADACLEALRGAPDAVVSDVASAKSHVQVEVETRGVAGEVERFVAGHPMGGSERSGPEFASDTVLEGSVWALCPGARTGEIALARVESFVARLGARPIRISAERHDRLVGIISHLPQVASTALMALAADEESGEPELLLLAAGGFRDLTRLAASNPTLWREILLANREEVAEAIDRYSARLLAIRDLLREGDGDRVEEAFARAKSARLSLGAKPQVRAGVAVVQVPIPDRPGALAELTRSLGDANINIEDLQIVHSPEGGRGVVHLTVVAAAADEAARALAKQGLSSLRLA
jgi:prephenate dehydrogenase